MTAHEPSSFRAFLFSRSGLALIGFLAVAGFFLWQEHSAHLLGYLPLILILGACLGMHFFMHGGQGGKHGSGDDSTQEGDK